MTHEVIGRNFFRNVSLTSQRFSYLPIDLFRGEYCREVVGIDI